MRIRLLGACAAVALAAGLVGCTGEEDPGPQTIGPESSTSATGSASSSAALSSAAVTTAPKPAQTFPPEQQPIVDVYYGYYDALYSLQADTDDSVRAALTPYATAEVVEFVVGVFAKYRLNGEESRGWPTYGTIEVVVDGQAAVIRECRDSSSESVVKVDTGEVVDYGSPNTQTQTDLAIQPTGNWAVTETYATGGGC
ncbi:hypothetical protein GCM10027298_00530 [Epidermidibacterium keratini]